MSRELRKGQSVLISSLVILAGGLGTRLQEETEFRPKPMVQIGGMPILWHIMKYYSTWGINNFVVCTGYKGEMIKDYFLNYRTNQNNITVKLGKSSSLIVHEERNEDWTVSIVDTGPLTPTGGRLFKAQQYIDGENFYCTYGDGVANVHLGELTTRHFENKAVGTITAVKPLSRFGVLDINEDRNVKSFREKPRMDSWINGGYFVFSQDIFAKLNADSILEYDPLIQLSEEGKLAAHLHEGFWQPMDTAREVKFLNELWNNNQAEWKIWN